MNFDLLVDKDYQLANKVGVYQLKKSFGKENMGIVRTTFILDENGNIIDVIEKVKVKTQIETIKKYSGGLILKIVSLNRLNEIENELRKQFANEEFKFYDKAINILLMIEKLWTF